MRDGTEQVKLRIRNNKGLIAFVNIRGADIVSIQEHGADPFCTIVTKDCSFDTCSVYENVLKQLGVETQKRLGFTEIKKHTHRHK